MESNERFDIELSTFVDLAVSIVSLSRRYRESQTATSCYPGTESIIISQDKMRSEWKSRIQPWLVSRTNFRDSFEDCEDLKDFKFSTFFLQYTVPAMHLWNVMQEFYELDRVVCRISEKSEVKIVDWESMGFFEYLKSKKVEKKWRNSLNTIKRSTEARDEVSPKILPLKWSVKQNDETISAERAMPTESRIASIQYGVDTLAEAWEALRRSFTENLKDLDIAHSMFSEIQVAVERRFLMVDNALRLDDSMDVSREIEQLDDQTRDNENPKFNEPAEPTFKPLRRTNTIKAYAIVFVSSRKGEATVGAIFIMFVLLVLLYQLLQFLDDTS